MRLLEVSGKYGWEFRVKFGVDKSQVIVIEGQEGEWQVDVGRSRNKENEGV